jgi:hypothetical protein
MRGVRQLVTADPGAIDLVGVEAHVYLELHDLCYEKRTIATTLILLFLKQEWN